MLRLLGTVLLVAALAGAADARGYRGHVHYSYAGKRVGGVGSSHRAGHYVNWRTGNHYRHHRR